MTNPASPGFASRVRGCLLGGAIGDQLGYTAESGGWPDDGAAPERTQQAGRFSAATQLTLYSLDGITEALEWANAGAGADEAACLWLAYLRWYATQDGRFPDAAPEPAPRWIDRQEVLQHRRSPDESSLSALATGEMGTPARPLNRTARDSGALVRSAPFGLVPFVPAATVYKLAVDCAAITHGHPDAQHAAAAFSSIIRLLVQEGAGLAEAVLAAGRDAPESVGRVLLEVLESGRLPDPEQQAAPQVLAAAAGTVLAAAGTGDAGTEEHWRRALTAAAGRGAAVASLAGQLLGACYGEAGLPRDWLRDAEAPELVLEMADRFLAQTPAPEQPR